MTSESAIKVFEVKAKGIGTDEKRRISVLRRGLPGGWTVIGFCGPDSVEVATSQGAEPYAVRGASFEPRGAVTIADVMRWQDAPGRVLSRNPRHTCVLDERGAVFSRGNAAGGYLTTGFGDVGYWWNFTTLASFAGDNELTDAGREVLEAARNRRSGR